MGGIEDMVDVIVDLDLTTETRKKEKVIHLRTKRTKRRKRRRKSLTKRDMDHLSPTRRNTETDLEIETGTSLEKRRNISARRGREAAPVWRVANWRDK